MMSDMLTFQLKYLVWSAGNTGTWGRKKHSIITTADQTIMFIRHKGGKKCVFGANSSSQHWSNHLRIAVRMIKMQWGLCWELKSTLTVCILPEVYLGRSQRIWLWSSGYVETLLRELGSTVMRQIQGSIKTWQIWSVIGYKHQTIYHIKNVSGAFSWRVNQMW